MERDTQLVKRMAKPRAAVFWGEGLNTDLEMQLAFELAGAEADRVHVLDLLRCDEALDNYQIAVIPGGFLHGDDIASAKVFAVQLKHRMRDAIRRFIERDTLMIGGVCNGFQALVKSGILPYGDFEQTVTLTYNNSGRFEDRWVYLEANRDSPCIFTRGIERIYLPARHGEGKFVAPQEEINKLEINSQVALRYVGENGGQNPSYPYNPNGSINAIAGICDPTGRIFGMMPHPEAHLHSYLNPRWTRLKAEGRLPEEGDGLQIFRNAVEYFG